MTAPSLTSAATFAADVGAAVDDMAEHFNDHHADAMVLLARFGAGFEAAATARIVATSPTGILLESRGASGAVRCDRLSFTAPAADLASKRGELLTLIRAARTRAGKAVPLTRIERETAQAAALKTWPATVAAVKDVVPGLREITISGLAGFESPGMDAFVYVIVSQGDSALPADFKMAALRAWKGADRPAGAYYTIRRSRSDELDLWFVLHGDEGPLSAWAARATPGDRLAIWGPRSAFAPPPDTHRLLLIGDETALPAIAAIIENKRPAVPISAMIEVADERCELDMPCGKELDISWVHRGAAAPGSSRALYDALAERRLDTEGLFVFGAAESTRIREVRRMLGRDRGLSHERMHLTGYWRRR